jgi:hypothetical protein
MSDDYVGISLHPTPNLDRFIATRSDDDRMALGLDVLEAAGREAGDAGLVGWQVEVQEYVVAARDGKPLNRPLGEPVSEPEVSCQHGVFPPDWCEAETCDGPLPHPMCRGAEDVDGALEGEILAPDETCGAEWEMVPLPEDSR